VKNFSTLRKGIAMSKKHKYRGIIILTGVVGVFFLFIFNIGGLKNKASQFLQPDTIKANDRLISRVENLEQQVLSLKTILDACERDILTHKDATGNCSRIQAMPSVDLPSQISTERFEIRQIYRQMLAEKKKWDQYQHEKYNGIIEGTVEPVVIDSQDLDLIHEESLEYFVELESALKLHKRLIRDVRVFHDEIKYQKKHLRAQEPYELYDLKFELAPFARESAMVDALQQAMSALSAGIYEQEAVEVLDRISDEFTKPIQQLYEQQREAAEPFAAKNYNFNFYTVFGKKLMDYADNLARQSSISLGPSAFGELDFFNRRLSEDLYDLYLAGQDKAIDPNYLDVNELEQTLQVKN
jgi:hypothetical protein